MQAVVQGIPICDCSQCLCLREQAAVQDLIVDGQKTLDSIRARHAAGVVRLESSEVTAICTIMTKHPKSALIQIHGCGALVNIAYSGLRDPEATAALDFPDAPTGPHPDRGARLVSLGCVELVMTALKTHVAVLEVQQLGCTGTFLGRIVLGDDSTVTSARVVAFGAVD